jgi:predicted site-specific integrase-resolvase
MFSLIPLLSGSSWGDIRRWGGWSGWRMRIEVMNEQEEKAPQQELVEDLLSIVTLFSGRLYGMRSSKTKKVVEVVKRAIS